ncbi:MAG: cytochrome c peroxidase [Bacteroidota bacterium]
MKKIFVLLVLATSFFIANSAFSPSEKQNFTIITERQESRLREFTTQVSQLKSLLEHNNGQKDIQLQFLKVRTAFKRWEYLGEFLDPVLVKDKINGAPLFRLERNTFGLNITRPNGLQALDELLFADSINTNEALPVVSELSDVLNELIKVRYPIYDRIVLEAARTELIRLFSLGLTGFDVPASGRSVADAVVVLQSIQEDLKLYQVGFASINSPHADVLYSRLFGSIQYLQGHQNFDSLNRLYVLKEFINPIFKEINYFHQASGIETINEVSAFLPPLNLNVDNIFSPALIDDSKYIGLPKKLNTPQLVSLGRTLFFDPVLSSNNQRSCAGCHDPSKAFSDGNIKSIAMNYEGTVDRNAPTLINCVYSEKFFHDLRAEALEDQIEHVVVSRKEFNTSVFEILSKLQSSKEYQDLFDNCFDKDNKGNNISNQNVSFAIAAYVSSLKSMNSPFDRYVRGESKSLDPSVERGFNLFMGKAACGTCHYAPLFNGTVPPRFEESESEVLGVPENPYTAIVSLDKDLGRGVAKLKDQTSFYMNSFKTPTIRNIALTGPYMHNGSYRTLEDVMDFYNHGGGRGIGLDVPTQTLSSDSLHLSPSEIKDIINFMQSLTDTTGLCSKPSSLPRFAQHPEWNKRKIGGAY